MLVLGGNLNYWVITDTHFGHQEIHKYCQRPKGFEDIILKNLRHYTKNNDVLIHLGDICFYKDEEWHKMICDSCSCKRWLIRGNHDRKTISWYLSHGWDVVADEMRIKIFGKKLIFSHYPITNVLDYDLNIHGHLHNTKHHVFNMTKKHHLVIMEHDYKPISLRKIIEDAIKKTSTVDI